MKLKIDSGMETRLPNSTQFGRKSLFITSEESWGITSEFKLNTVKNEFLSFNAHSYFKYNFGEKELKTNFFNENVILSDCRKRVLHY